MKRLLLSLFCAVAMAGTASAVTALPAAAGGQRFYVSTSLSDSAGRAVNPTIYNIEGRTFFKLRDLGRLLDFGVTFDKSKNAVYIDPAASYIPAANEGDVVKNTAAAAVPAVPTAQNLYVSGQKVSPAVYNIKGNNYIGLRALGELVDFSVSYDYDTRRITAYAAYPYAAETTWSAAMNDMANNLRASNPASYHLIAARYAPIVTGRSGADWRDLISTLRAAKASPIVAESDDALYRASLYWANALSAAAAGTTAALPPKLGAALPDLADAALFDNPDRTALRRDFSALSCASLSPAKPPFSGISVSNGYARDALARFSLANTYTLTDGVTEADVKAAKASLADDMAALSALPDDSARLAYIERLLRREFRTGGSKSWAAVLGQNGRVSPFSLAAAANWMLDEAGIPAVLARSYSSAWNVIYTGGSWAVFDPAKGSGLRSLDEYRLIDTHPGATLFATQALRPGSSYDQAENMTARRYFTYTALAGEPQATVSQMVAYIRRVNPNVPQSVLDMLPLYLAEGRAEGIRGDIAFAQSCLETGNFTFADSAASLEGNNFCGLGILENGMQGAAFDTPQQGIRAQIQHLKAYANRQPLKNECIDPRFHLVARGAAPTVQYLGMQENPQGYGWAAGADYGVKILNILENILAC
ncbi:MAG: glucosaminidase domain-containing protein [Agathobaculum sp.]|uniref:glucosaminidase domain-containing protein n=1 Tax=Agathobaculum sp. TaxID=2048138 RepID=UPI003D8E7C3A